MHEMSVAESILELITNSSKKENFTQVRKIRLALGIFSTIEPQALDFCFDVVTKGSIAEKAKLEITIVNGQGWCMLCSKNVELKEREVQCPECGSYQIQITSGDEMKIVDVEVE